MSTRADLTLRQVGESYRDYADRMAGAARAAEMDRDALRFAVLDLGGIVQAACDELGIHHDTSAAEVVAAIRALRAALVPPISAACHHPGTRTCGICAAPGSPVSPAPDQCADMDCAGGFTHQHVAEIDR